MSLDLDPRQRAMLAEMGVRVWLPAAPVGVPEVVVSPARAAATHGSAVVSVASAPGGEPVVMRKPAVAMVQPAGTAAVASPTADGAAGPLLTQVPADLMQADWAALAATMKRCQACAMGAGRRRPVMAAANPECRADWMVVGEAPDDAQERAGQPFVGEAGTLLDNMLRAVGVRRLNADTPAQAVPSSLAYLTPVLKCHPAMPTSPDARAMEQCAHYLRREIELVRPRVILAMGRLAMQVLLSEDHPQGLMLPLARLRGAVWHYQRVPVVVTYPPAYLLRSGQDKARAWEDLCLALNVARGETSR